MRQVVAFLNAIERRKLLHFYETLCLHAGVNGAKISKTFAEMFPQYGEEEVPVAVPPETAKLMEDLAKEQVQRANKAYGRG